MQLICISHAACASSVPLFVVIADMWVRMCGGGDRVPAVSEGAAVRETG